MVYVGIHVKRIAVDLRETLESKAEIYPATWAAFQVLEKAIAEEMPKTGGLQGRKWEGDSESGREDESGGGPPGAGCFAEGGGRRTGPLFCGTMQVQP